MICGAERLDARSPVGAGQGEPEPQPEQHQAAVKLRKSLANRDLIISLIDGKPDKSLKRHLTGHGLTPAEYRQRYNLPASYPMVAPGYSNARREVAKRLGLGRKPNATYPYDDVVPDWARYVWQVVRVGAIVWVGCLGAWFLGRRHAARAAAIVGATIVLVHETLRVLVVNNILVDGFVGERWLFLVINAMPNAIVNHCNRAAGVLVSRYLFADHRRKPVSGAVAILAAAGIGLFLLHPALHRAATAIQSILHLLEPPELYLMPYGLYQYSFNCGTFVEPTLATSFLVYLTWPALPRSSGLRLVTFVVHLLLVRGRVITTGLFRFWIRQPIPRAFAAEGQLFVETLVMALLVGVAWTVVSRGKPINKLDSMTQPQVISSGGVARSE